MNFKDKMKLFFETFFNDNKAVFITLLMLFLLFIFAKLNTVSASSSDYIEVEYVTLSSSLLTDYTPTSNTRIVLDFKDEDTTITGWQNIIATSNGTSDTIKFLIQRQGSESRYNVYFGRSGTGYENRFSMKNNTRHVIDYNKNNLYLDGTLVASMTYWDWTCEEGYYIALNINGSSAYSSAFTVYSLKIYEGDQLVRDYVPCINRLTSTYTFYDKCNNKFLSAGSATGGEPTQPILPTLQLSVSTTETTSQGVKIYTQDFTEDFINSHKCYYSYSYDENNNRIWYPCEISDTYSYYTNAWENGAYVFRLEDLEGNNISTATMNITNIQTTPIIDNDSVICPVLSVKPSGLNSVDVFTQSLTLSNISRLECYYWLSSENGSFTNKNKLLATDIGSNGVRNLCFKYTLSKDDTIYFVFYDKFLDKYSYIVSLTVNINEVLTNPSFGNTDQLSILLHQKFGVFYSFSYFLSDFWYYLNNLDDTKPNFNITLPDFLGGGTYSAFDFTFYDNYRMYVHYIIAGFCYFFFIKYVINKIINLLNIS